MWASPPAEPPCNEGGSNQAVGTGSTSHSTSSACKGDASRSRTAGESSGLLSRVLEPDQWEDARAEARAAKQQSRLIQDLNETDSNRQPQQSKGAPASAEVWLSRDPEKSRAVLALLKPTADTSAYSRQHSGMSTVHPASAASGLALAPGTRAGAEFSSKDATSPAKAARQPGHKSKNVFKRLFSKCKCWQAAFMAGNATTGPLPAFMAGNAINGALPIIYSLWVVAWCSLCQCQCHASAVPCRASASPLCYGNFGGFGGCSGLRFGTYLFCCMCLYTSLHRVCSGACLYLIADNAALRPQCR
jgi:hypothetical protein